MDHNEALRKFEHLIIREADHAHEAATELEALVPLLPSEKSRQLARLQVKASHKLAKDLRSWRRKPEKPKVLCVSQRGSQLFCWRPRRDLNPCYRRERAMS
jgi:hypothetical protein